MALPSVAQHGLPGTAPVKINIRRRRKIIYEVPELRLSNTWLKGAGFSAGDRVAVTSPEPGCLLISALSKPSGSP